MNTTNVKAMVAKFFTVGLLAGAVILAAPSKAEAQVSFGVRVGPVYNPPVYVAPAYGYYGRYDRDDWYRRQEFARQQEYLRQQEFLRQQAFARERQEREEHERFEHRDFGRDRFDADRRFDDHRDGGRSGR